MAVTRSVLRPTHLHDRKEWEFMENWRMHAACRDEDPDLFFPIGGTGPALVRTEDAKAVCRGGRAPGAEAARPPAGPAPARLRMRAVSHPPGRRFAVILPTGG